MSSPQTPDLPDPAGDLPSDLPENLEAASELVLTLTDGVATLWLNRPAKRNALTHAMWRGLGDLCRGLDLRADVRMLVLRGVGDHFCAGADISGLTSMPLREYHRANDHADGSLAAFSKPTIAFITGSCIGGGVEIASSCDLRIADDTAILGITPAKLGVLYPPRAVERVTRLIGPSAAKQLFFTGELIDSARALRIGLLDEVCPGASHPERLAELSDLIGRQRSLFTQMASKAMIDATSSGDGVPPSMEEDWMRALESSSDLTEGVAAFTERRTPVFGWTPTPHG